MILLFHAAGFIPAAYFFFLSKAESKIHKWMKTLLPFVEWLNIERGIIR